MKKYEKYKDSGIKWLVKIPEHWKVRRIKDLTDKVGSGVTPKGGAEVYSDRGIMFFRSQNIQNNRLDYTDIAYISSKIDKKMSSTRIRHNDILLNITGASIGRCFYVSSNIKGNVNQHVCIIRPIHRRIDTHFLHYSIISPYGQNLIMFCQNGANREGLSFQLINNFKFLVPSTKEQVSIANYLDSKTQLIDKKIELLDKKIQKYRELRKTLIYETVCRGLDKDVKLVDCEIESIGKIPKHWEIRRLKSLGSLETSSIDKKIKKNEPLVKLINYTDVYNNITKELWNSDEYMEVSVNKKQQQTKTLKKGDVLFTPSSETIEDIGVSAVIMDNLYHILYSYHLLRLRFTKDDIFIDYKKYLFNNLFVQYYFSSCSIGTTRKILGLNAFNNLLLPLPPYKEQITAANYLNNKTQKIDSIINNIQQQISKLQELRKTLVNDVVTGKIKVTE